MYCMLRRDAATGEVRIGIFTTREVSGYEELTYDYMFEHYGLSSGLAQGFKCQCGAKNCRLVVATHIGSSGTAIYITIQVLSCISLLSFAALLAVLVAFTPQ